MGTGIFASTARFYIHDHLYSPVALTDYSGTILERYEYDAYGNPTIWNADFTTERDSSNYGNPYLFTGRRVDYLDSGSLKIQYNRNRYYDYYTGRWLTHDPLGITPNPQGSNKFDSFVQYKVGMSYYDEAQLSPSMFGIIANMQKGYHFSIIGQYEYGLSLYQPFESNPVINIDPLGFWGEYTHLTKTKEWAVDVGYTTKCAKIIGEACNNVDTISNHIGPFPLIGDMSYHFDTDPSGFFPITDARINHFKDHYENANSLASSAVTWAIAKGALKQLGTALHPLQDTFSYNDGHKAAMPMLHAPQAYCVFIGDPLGIWNPFCFWQMLTNENWWDPHLPDKATEWPVDHYKTKKETEKILEEFLGNECFDCYCKQDFP